MQAGSKSVARLFCATMRHCRRTRCQVQQIHCRSTFQGVVHHRRPANEVVSMSMENAHRYGLWTRGDLLFSPAMRRGCGSRCRTRYGASGRMRVGTGGERVLEEHYSVLDCRQKKLVGTLAWQLESHLPACHPPGSPTVRHARRPCFVCVPWSGRMQGCDNGLCTVCSCVESCECEGAVSDTSLTASRFPKQNAVARSLPLLPQRTFRNLIRHMLHSLEVRMALLSARWSTESVW